MGKAIKTGANIASLGAIGGGPLSLLGKKDPGAEATTTNLLSPEAQRISQLGLSQYESLLKEDPTQLAQAQIAAQENAIRAAAEDRQRLAKQMVAQRGLGSSSIGLNAILGGQKQMADQIGAARAQFPALQRDIKLGNLQAATSGISSLIGAQTGGQIYTPGRESMGRRGGLAPLLGLGAGYAMGGAGGAQAGMGAGQALTQLG